MESILHYNRCQIRPTRLTEGKNEQQGLDMQEKSAITLVCSIKWLCVCVCTGPQLQSGSPIASPLTGSHVSRVGLWECEMSLSPWAKDTQPNGRSQSSPKSAVWEWHIVLELSLMAAVHINMTRKHTGKMHECDNKMEPRVLTYQGSINRQPRKKKKSLALHSRCESPHNCMFLKCYFTLKMKIVTHTCVEQNLFGFLFYFADV